MCFYVCTYVVCMYVRMYVRRIHIYNICCIQTICLNGVCVLTEFFIRIEISDSSFFIHKNEFVYVYFLSFQNVSNINILDVISDVFKQSHSHSNWTKYESISLKYGWRTERLLNWITKWKESNWTKRLAHFYLNFLF